MPKEKINGRIISQVEMVIEGFIDEANMNHKKKLIIMIWGGLYTTSWHNTGILTGKIVLRCGDGVSRCDWHEFITLQDWTPVEGI